MIHQLSRIFRSHVLGSFFSHQDPRNGRVSFAKGKMFFFGQKRWLQQRMLLILVFWVKLYRFICKRLWIRTHVRWGKKVVLTSATLMFLFCLHLYRLEVFLALFFFGSPRADSYQSFRQNVSHRNVPSQLGVSLCRLNTRILIWIF